MNARVQRESVGQPAVCEMPKEAEVARPQAPRVCKPAADDVERFRATENDVRAGKLGGMVERELRTVASGLPDGAKAELELTASCSVKGVTANVRGNVGLERKGQEYRVTLGGLSGAGIGKKDGDVSASVTGNLAGKVTLRYGSGEEMADNVAALVQVAARANGGLVGAAVAVLGDPDAVPRSLHAVDRIESIELSASAVAELNLKMPANPSFQASFGESATVTPLSVKLDLRKGEVVFSSSASAEIKGSASAELIPKMLSVKSPLTEVKAKGEVALRASYPLSREDLARIAREPRELQKIASDPSRQWTWTADATVSGQVLDMDFVARRSGPPREMLEAFSRGDLLRLRDVHFEGFQVQAGIGVKADAGVASFSVTQKTRLKILDGKGQFVPLMEQAVTKAREHQAQERNLQVRQLLRR